MTHRAFIGVGSNIEPERHLPLALGALLRGLDRPVCRLSTHYRTSALNRPEQPDFVNGVWMVVTDRNEEVLRRLLDEVEQRQERERTGDRYAARTLDLDLLLYDDVRAPERQLPHPDIRQRPWIYGPLLELVPGIVLPGDDRPLADTVDVREVRGLTGDDEIDALLKGILT